MIEEELKKLVDYGVPIQYIIWTIVVIIALIIIAAKVFPTFKNWFNLLRKVTNKYEELQSQIEKNTRDIEIINQKIDKDYIKLNELHNLTVKQQKYIEDSLEERELIIRSLLGVVQGLQEVGANGPTKKAEAEIQAYLLRKSHETSE